MSKKPWEHEKPWIANLNLSLRASWRIYSCYHSLEELLCATDSDLLRMGNFGTVSLQELKQALDKAGLVRTQDAKSMLRAALQMEESAARLRLKAKQALDRQVLDPLCKSRQS